MLTLYVQLTSTRATVRYGTGSVALSLMYDTVNIAGISIPHQGVGLATALTSDFDYVSCDGLVVRQLAKIKAHLDGRSHRNPLECRILWCLQHNFLKLVPRLLFAFD